MSLYFSTTGGNVICYTAKWNGTFSSDNTLTAYTISNDELVWEMGNVFTLLGGYKTGERTGSFTLSKDNKELKITTTSSGANTATTTTLSFTNNGTTNNIGSTTATRQRLNYIVAVLDNNEDIALAITNSQDNSYVHTYGILGVNDPSASGFGNGYLNEPPSTPTITVQHSDLISDFVKNNSTYKDPLNTDPYNNQDSMSGSGGGGGEGLDSVSGSDINDPDLPELSAVSTGLVSIFTPSLSQLQALGDFLWSDLFSLDTFKKIFTDPWDAILGLSILGVGVSGGTSSVVNIGNVSTGVSMPKLSTQYYKFNCGSITLKETWGSYLDYNPYTKVSIYLPFIGTHALNVDDIMGRTISLKYNIDILSGACVANIQCGGAVMYSFTGCCSATIPLSGSSYTNMINGILGVATSIGAAVATGGAAAPVTAATITGSVMSSLKTDVSRTGNVSGMAGIMGVKSAYLIMEVPRICVPKNQDKYIGYPTYVTKKVGDLSGYCVFEDIKVRGNSHATIGEIEEIESIMKEGVYL